jgi:hypothetical protein
MIKRRAKNRPFFILRMMAPAPAVEDHGKKAMSGLPNCHKTATFFRRSAE